MIARDVILEFGFPLLLCLLAAALAVAIAVWFVWRASPRVGRFLALILLLGTAAFVTGKSLSPSGKYAVGGCRGPGLRALGMADQYYELSGGVFYDVVNGHARRMGLYGRDSGRWIIRWDGDGPFAEQELKFSPLGFYTILPTFGDVEGGPTSFNRRRIIPFSRPDWMPEWLE